MFKFVHAKQPSDVVDPAKTMGIEATDAAVSDRCGLGNIDGQHGMDTPSEWQGKAAIQIATRLDVQVPFAGTTFATSRPDVDSIGAMAALVLRALGLGDAIDRELVATIAQADSFRPGGEWQPRPLPTEENPWPGGTNSVDGTQGIAHLGTICSPRNGDVGESMTLADRVFVMAWALTERSVAYIDRSQSLDRWALMEPIAKACGSTSSIDADQVLGQVHDRVLGSRRELARAAQAPGAVIVDNGVAVVRVAHAGALGLGYCVAPVVIAFDQGIRGKVTIAPYSPGHLEFQSLRDELNRLEAKAGGDPKWGGGTSGITGSPQNGGTVLPDDAIVNTVRRFLK